jgi:hypothetical protein
MSIEDDARAKAERRYASRVVEDYDGDRYEEDEWGFDATARSAFVEGALWAASRREKDRSAIDAEVERRAREIADHRMKFADVASRREPSEPGGHPGTTSNL